MSYTEESDKVNIHPYDYSKDYLTFVIRTNGTINFSGTSSGDTANTISYSLDNGENWSEQSNNVEISVNKGNKILIKGGFSQSVGGPLMCGTFSQSTAEFDVEGNIMSLIYGDDYQNQYTLNINFVFYSLFGLYNNQYFAKVINAKNLVLPATTLANNCYVYMFAGCTSLTSAPQLPATTLAQNCYAHMFRGCTSLTSAPQLPATTLANGCYQYMFYNCNSLTKAPQLPATMLAQLCYSNMFEGCTSLTTAPQLPATTLANYCYSNMFYGCTNLNYIKMLATNISASNCLSNWVNSVSSTGTFVKSAEMSTLPSGASGIPNGWTVQDASQ